MQIKEIKISNILSFPYVPDHDFENMESVSLYGDNGYQGVRIFIGNNASGKSNFIKILEEFFATLIKDFSYTDEFPIKNQMTRKTIQERKNQTRNLQTNNQAPDKPAKIEISLELSAVDYENIGFVCKYSSKINAIIGKYSKLNLSFPQYKLQKLMELPHSLKLIANFNERAQVFTIDESKLNKYELFMLNCIRYQKLFQIIITLFNSFEKEE